MPHLDPWVAPAMACGGNRAASRRERKQSVDRHPPVRGQRERAGHRIPHPELRVPRMPSHGHRQAAMVLGGMPEAGDPHQTTRRSSRPTRDLGATDALELVTRKRRGPNFLDNSPKVSAFSAPRVIPAIMVKPVHIRISHNCSQLLITGGQRLAVSCSAFAASLRCLTLDCSQESG